MPRRSIRSWIYCTGANSVAQGVQIDQLDPLTPPVRAADRLVIGRGGDLYRLDTGDWLRGIGERRNEAVPRASDFPIWVNQDGAVIVDHDDGFSLRHEDANAGDSLQMRLRAIPSGTWDVRLGCVRGHRLRSLLISGLILRESVTGKLLTFSFGHPSSGGIFINAWSSPTEFSGTRKNFEEDRPQRQWFRVALNGSDIEFHAGADGVDYSFFHSQTLTTDFTSAPDQWGAFINPRSSVTPRVSLRLDVIDWSEQ